MNFADATVPRLITEVTRRNILDTLILRGDFSGRLDKVTFLNRVWDLSTIRSTDRREPNLDADLRRHISWGDEGYDDAGILFAKLNILKRPDEEFGNFLAQSLHPVVQADTDKVAEMLSLFNNNLAEDGFVLVQSDEMSGLPVYEMTRIGSKLAVKSQRYDVALSFASEQGKYVREVAEKLTDAGVSLFYAPYEEANLWGEDLIEVFDGVFLHGSRFVVMFISADYERKMWPSYERRVAVERAIKEKLAYVLPVRFDDTEIPGIRGTVFYQDARSKTPAEIANLVLRRLGRVK